MGAIGKPLSDPVEIPESDPLPAREPVPAEPEKVPARG